MLRFTSIFLFVSALLAAPAVAQQHTDQHKFATTEHPTAHEWRWKFRHFSPRLFRSKEANEEKRFGYFGYRHKEMHRRGLVQRLQELTGSKCCEGESSGECRVSVINTIDWTVEIDGITCPMPRGMKIYPLAGMDLGLALVCARASGVKCVNVNVYCVGADGGG